MPSLEEIHQKLLESSVFKNWNTNHQRSYLASFFQILKGENPAWQIDYYEKDSDEMTAFIFDPSSENISLDQQNSKVFKEPKQMVDELRLEKVKTPLEDALQIAEKTLGRFYPGEIITVKIIILQRIKHELYNITFVTGSLATVNVRIDASNGEVLSHEKAGFGMQVR